MRHDFLVIFIIFAVVILTGVGCGNQVNYKNKTATVVNDNSKETVNIPKLSEPIADALARITKKPFGIKVSLQNSPVKPESFSGYHTGVDFEILSGEENTDVIVYSVCTGKVLEKRWVSGYGGVLVQSCSLDNQDITVVYGHLNLISVDLEVGQNLSAKMKIGFLGKGYSQETDQERKHLHLGIHKGSEINLRGYVDSIDKLSSWIDIIPYLKN